MGLDRPVRTMALEVLPEPSARSDRQKKPFQPDDGSLLIENTYRTVLSIDDALRFIAHEDIFWVIT
jgi:hypothetical protein